MNKVDRNSPVKRQASLKKGQNKNHLARKRKVCHLSDSSDHSEEESVSAIVKNNTHTPGTVKNTKTTIVNNNIKKTDMYVKTGVKSSVKKKPKLKRDIKNIFDDKQFSKKDYDESLKEERTDLNDRVDISLDDTPDTADTPETPGKRLDFGKELIRKMGWTEGQGLGLHEQGNPEPLEQSKQKGRRGLGYSLQDIKIEVEFEWESERETEYVCVEERVDWIVNYDKDIPSQEELKSWSVIGTKKLSIDDEDYFCDSKILKSVLSCKGVFDSLSGDELRKARSQSNPFESLEKAFFQNRAALKMANLDAVFDFMFTNPVDEEGNKMVKDNDLLYFADICAGPGGFSEYVLWRKSWHAKGFGFTLKGENDFKLHEFFAASTETFEPHYGEGGLDGNGDIYLPQNLIAFRNFVLQNTEHKGVHFVMGDGGFSVQGQENIQEILSKRLYLCQFCCALSILRPGGSFVCKLFDTFTPFSVGLIYLMYLSFQQITIHKPNTSRPANSERYIVCKWKKKVDPIEQYLFLINCQLGTLDSDSDVTEVVPFEIINDDDAFRNFITKSNNDIGRRQIFFLSKVKAFAENPDLIEIRQNELKKLCLEYWQIPKKSRVAPTRVDPQTKFLELVNKSQNGKEYFAHKATVLSKDVMESMKNIHHGHKFMVLTADKDDLCSNLQTCVRGFFLGLGKQNIYYWDGSCTTKWIRADTLRLELPPDTLLYAEQVQELKGEGKGQRKMFALHIIDGIFIGGQYIGGLSFEKRIALINKMVKAVTKPTQTEFNPVRTKRVYNIIDAERIINNMKKKDCKGSQKEKVCYEIDDDRFVIPFAFLIMNIIQEPWTIQWSRTANKHYYFNVKNGTSLFEVNENLLANFKSTFSNRIIWKLQLECSNSPNDCVILDQLTRYMISYIHNKKNK